MTAFTRQIETAKRLIEKNGAKCIWRSIPDGVAADSEKPWNVSAVDNVDHIDIPICFLPYSRVNTGLIRAISNAPELEIGDFYGLMGQVDFEPKKTDTVITPDNKVFRIVQIDVLQPDLTPILYTIGFVL